MWVFSESMFFNTSIAEFIRQPESEFFKPQPQYLSLPIQ